VSVTDRCNFRCQYCMPAEGLPWLERAALLTYEEIERLDGETVALRGRRGEIGFISPVSEPFCGDCNRIRVTAEGMLRTCLFSMRETDLRTPLREGADDVELACVIRDAVRGNVAT
jgi:molybdenum cofactor biosynthesis enzyme MoaA